MKAVPKARTLLEMSRYNTLEKKPKTKCSLISCLLIFLLLASKSVL